MPAQAAQIRTNVKKATKEAVELERYSEGFLIRVALDFSKTGKSQDIRSGFAFVDSLLKGISDFSGFGISLEIPRQAGKDEEIVKNAGFALGEAVRKLYEKRKGRETGVYINSDGKALCMFAIGAKRQSGEANLQIIGTPGRGFEPDRFFVFFDGFAQGFEAEINAVVNLGSAGGAKKDQVEFVSKAFAEALKQMLK